jgi:WD40 repeat protein
MGRIPIALVLLVSGFCVGRSTAADPLPHDGEPLPPGALARLGGSRWRHGSTIVRSALSPDGKRLATVSNSSVVVWEIATGKVLFRFPTLSTKDRAQVFGYYSGPRILAFSPDGKKLGIAFNDEFTGVWDLENGGRFRRFTGEDVDNSHGHCQFSRDGKLFVLLYSDCIRFWDPVTGDLRRQIPASFAVADISADARMYVQIDHNRNVAFNVRDFKTGATVKEFDVRAGQGEALFAPDSKTIVLTDELKKEIQIWDAPPTKVRCTFSLPKSAGVTHDGRFYKPYSVCFTADSKVLMLGNFEGHIYRWDLATKKQLPVLSRYRGEIVGLHGLPDRKTLIAVGSDGLIHRFDTTTNREISDAGKYEGWPEAVVSADGRLAAVSDHRGRLDLWELRPLKLRHALRSTGSPVCSAAFAKDGKTLAVGLESETVCLYDLASGRETRRISLEKNEQTDIAARPGSRLMLSPDERFLYVNSSASELLCWDLAKGQVRWRCKGEFAWGEGAAALSPDGKILAFAPEGAEVLLLDAATGNKGQAAKLAVTDTGAIAESVESLAFSPDGSSLAVALGDGTIALLDPATAKETKRLAAGSYLTGNLAFSPGGRTIAVGVMESVCLLDTNTGKMLSRLEGHTDRINSIGFGPDGRTLLSSGYDAQVYLWSLETKAPPRE